MHLWNAVEQLSGSSNGVIVQRFVGQKPRRHVVNCTLMQTGGVELTVVAFACGASSARVRVRCVVSFHTAVDHVDIAWHKRWVNAYHNIHRVIDLDYLDMNVEERSLACTALTMCLGAKTDFVGP